MRLARAVLWTIALTPGTALATEQWEVNASAFGLVGRDRAQWDGALGGVFDTYVTDGVGAWLGATAHLVFFPRESARPSDLAVSPEVAVWFGDDAPTFRSFVVARPVFGVLDLDDDGARTFEHLELGPGAMLTTRDLSLRVRAALLWSPATDPRDGSLELASVGLRLTFGYASPLRLPPAAGGPCPLPCTPGCPC